MSLRQKHACSCSIVLFCFFFVVFFFCTIRKTSCLWHETFINLILCPLHQVFISALWLQESVGFFFINPLSVLCLFVRSLVSEGGDESSCNLSDDNSSQRLKFCNLQRLEQRERLLLSVHKVSSCALTSVISLTATESTGFSDVIHTKASFLIHCSIDMSTWWDKR